MVKFHFAQVHPVKEPLADAKQRWNDMDLHLVDQASGKELLYRAGAAAKYNVTTACRIPRLVQCRFDPVGDEVKCGSSPHWQRFALVVSENVNRIVEWRISPHHPFHASLTHGPRTGPNILRPMITEPTLSNDSRNTSSFIPDSPPSPSPCKARKVFVAKTQSWRRNPPSPIGFSALWFGPATNPSNDIVILHLSLLMVF